MLKSRRGLLAAGLAVAVVGTIGVASTLNAGAEQVSGPPRVSTAPVAADEDVRATPPTPPRVLPWGERPEWIKKGRPGANAKSLRAAGLDAAPADPDGSIVPDAKRAPKGRTMRSSVLRKEVTEIAPPPKPLGVAAEPGNDVNYLYNVGTQAAETSGVYANVTIAKPRLEGGDFHTLAELALQSADGTQIVEVGWTIDRVVNGDDDPHLFVFHWVNGVPACYNGCGFVPYSKNVPPGSTLSYGVTKKFGIQFFNDAWWIAFDSEWVGYFPHTLWTKKGVTFDRSGLVQVFGEVAASDTTSCTDMGNGSIPLKEDDKNKDNDPASRLSSVTYLEGPKVDMNIRSTVDTKMYDVTKVSGRSFRYGGPGKTKC